MIKQNLVNGRTEGQYCCERLSLNGGKGRGEYVKQCLCHVCHSNKTVQMGKMEDRMTHGISKAINCITLNF